MFRPMRVTVARRRLPVLVFAHASDCDNRKKQAGRPVGRRAFRRCSSRQSGASAHRAREGEAGDPPTGDEGGQVAARRRAVGVGAATRRSQGPRRSRGARSDAHEARGDRTGDLQPGHQPVRAHRGVDPAKAGDAPGEGHRSDQAPSTWRPVKPVVRSRRDGRKPGRDET